MLRLSRKGLFFWLGFKEEQRTDCIFSDKINLVDQQNTCVGYIKIHSLKYFDFYVVCAGEKIGQNLLACN